jgi:MoxR-like ATPase
MNDYKAPTPPTSINPEVIASSLARIKEEMGKHIVGQHELIEMLLIALIADGHVLLEGVPGLAKTKTLTTLAALIDGTISRIQFTPDLLPSDLIGTEVYRPQTGEFVTRKGPLFANIVLADEINRAPAKVQSALLQAMQEHMVTIGDTTFRLPRPFLVLATQNPLEQEGTYPLPEAQVDRFLFKVKVNYPSYNEELAILRVVTEESRTTQPITPILSMDILQSATQAAHALFSDEKVDRYIVSLVQATRTPEAFNLKNMVEWGASPRASIALQRGARARALLQGRNWITIDDVKALAPAVLRHRIVPSFEAESRGVDVDAILEIFLKSVPVP